MLLHKSCSILTFVRHKKLILTTTLCIALASALVILLDLFTRRENQITSGDEWHVVGNSAYQEVYRNHSTLKQSQERTFIGVLDYEKNCGLSSGVTTTLQRCNPYKINNIPLHPVKEEFFDSAGIVPGDKIELIGKKASFELEGQLLTEIFVSKIRSVD